METAELNALEHTPPEQAADALRLSPMFVDELATVGVFCGALLAMVLFSTHLKRAFAFVAAQKDEHHG